ncbi:endonuclease/exonuclease/phosphatase family protein [Snuella lapsa]|uniref:Endonuclease/exonuclease/phosphatase family protein n=2 Tax=Snuella lapsa TaxID=870481 RepID=A0ABP6YGH7_9FLAO
MFSVFGAFSQEQISVMSYNVGYDEALYNSGEPKENYWVNRRVHQVALINFHQPDIIGLQEPHLHQLKYLHENVNGYNWVGNGREDGMEAGEYNPIFYKANRFKLLQSGIFWLSETPNRVSKSWDAGYTRICTWALFENKETQKQFYVFNTHFDSKGKEARIKSATIINEKVNELDGNIPVFVLGDFNFSPESKAYNEMVTYGLNDSKTIVQSDPYGPDGTYNGFQFDRISKYRIDYVFVNSIVDVLKYGVLTDSYEMKYPSDHFPIWITAKIRVK